MIPSNLSHISICLICNASLSIRLLNNTYISSDFVCPNCNIVYSISSSNYLSFAFIFNNLEYWANTRPDTIEFSSYIFNPFSKQYSICEFYALKIPNNNDLSFHDLYNQVAKLIIFK